MSTGFNEFKTLVSPTLLMEYWYCPRFIYFMEVLKIRQYEEKRLKVLIGREVYEKKVLPLKQGLKHQLYEEGFCNRYCKLILNPLQYIETKIQEEL